MNNLDILSIPFFHTSEKLPEDNEYVLIHLVKDNWIDKDDINGKRYWRVAKFVRGISEEDRAKMKTGKLFDEIEEGFTYSPLEGKMTSYKYKRSDTYRSGDVFGNNHVPYVWDEFGPDCHFGQEVDIWAKLPILNK